MKKQVISWFIVLVFIALGIVIYIYSNKPNTPIVNSDGSIKGNYTIADIMSLNKPYKCTFTRSDETSKILGVIHTDSENTYGEFRILIDVSENEQFTSFLLTNGNNAYVWTSLQNVGYKSSTAKSARNSSSPTDQAQIIGKRDKVDYECSPWDNTDPSMFEVPSYINFSKI